jgi:hypothetical protein
MFSDLSNTKVVVKCLIAAATGNRNEQYVPIKGNNDDIEGFCFNFLGKLTEITS